MTGALGTPMLGIAPIWLLAGIFAVILYGFVMAIATHGREKQLGFATLAAGYSPPPRCPRASPPSRFCAASRPRWP